MKFHRSRTLLAAALAAAALAGCVAYVPAGPDYTYSGYTAYGPPPAQVERVPASPGAAYVWTPGFWIWGGSGYAWRGGRWAVPPKGYHSWQPGYWERHDRGHTWRPGRWR